MAGLLTGLEEWWEGPSHPDQVAKAYGLLNDKLQKDEQGKFDENFASNFTNYKDLKDKGQQDKGIEEWKGTDYGTPLERWRKQIDGMIQSGNPVLMKEGLSLLKQQHIRGTTPSDRTTDNRANAVKEYQYAQTPEGGSFGGTLEDWKRMAKARTVAPQLISEADASNMEFINPEEALKKFGTKEVLPYMNKEAIAGYVRSIDDGSKENIIAQTVLDLGNESLFGKDGQSGIYGNYDNGLADRFRLIANGNIQQVLQSDPEYRNYDQFRQGVAVSLAKSFGEAGALSNQDVARALSLLPNITGLIPDSPDVARQKMYLLQQLINAHTSGRKKARDELLAGVTVDNSKAVDSLTPGTQPDIGTIYEGRIFIGGDSTKEENWYEVNK